VTLPGMESPDADRSEITLRDHVDAVVELVDQVQDPVVLVGHSGGGAIIYAVADARPNRIVRTVYVDSGPLGDGDSINAELTVVDGEIPLPDWSEFEEQELVGLDEAGRREFRAKAIPSPGRVATDQQALQDERRYDIPATVITSTFPGPMLRELIDGGHPFTAELARVKDFEIVDLPTGHWPQVTRPADLAEAIITAVER
jgi:pimeloyl-ACP methyl ester carboxylesterase